VDIKGSFLQFGFRGVMTPSNCRLILSFYFWAISRDERPFALGLMYRVPIFGRAGFSLSLSFPEGGYGTTCALVAFIRLLHIQSALTEMYYLCTDQLSTVTNMTWIELIPFLAHNFLFGTFFQTILFRQKSKLIYFFWNRPRELDGSVY
jgi:hypothetical protein